MSLIEKLQKKVDEKKAQMQRGIEVTEQMRAEKKRKKEQKAKYCEPGTFMYGIKFKQDPIEFMKDVYDKRKMEREKK